VMTLDKVRKSGLNGRNHAIEPGLAIGAGGVPDRHCRRHAGDERNAWRYSVNRDANRHALSQGDPRVDRVDIGQSLRADGGIRHANATGHRGHMPKDGLSVSHQLRLDAIPDANPRHLGLFEVPVDPIAVSVDHRDVSHALASSNDGRRRTIKTVDHQPVQILEDQPG
jgi:hypothetical protein